MVSWDCFDARAASRNDGLVLCRCERLLGNSLDLVNWDCFDAREASRNDGLVSLRVKRSVVKVDLYKLNSNQLGN